MFARTDRLLLRPGWMEDAPALAAAIGEQAIVRNLATAPWPYERADACAWLAQPAGDLACCLIFARTAGRPLLVGGIGLHSTGGEVELGYWISRAHWNRGYATEAGHALLAFARDSLRLCRIAAGHFTDNPASGRVLEKLGFTATRDRAPRHSAARRSEAPF
ncbi:MAG TPA: GNAT family N-acetyltransferase [Sphingomonadaceae bacterium]|nr:GNAT family N-acetyltransferase [Sphingomonadaceae bacterium]